MVTEIDKIPPCIVSLFKRNRFHFQPAGDVIPLMQWCLDTHIAGPDRLLTRNEFLNIIRETTEPLISRTERFFAARNAAVTASQHEPDLLKNEIMRLLDSSDERRKLGDNLHALFPAAAARSFANLVVKTYAKAKQKKAFVIGIGGIGISSIVQYLIRSGYSVSGSDIIQSSTSSIVTLTRSPK